MNKLKVKIVRFYSGWERSVEYTSNPNYNHIIEEFMEDVISGFIIWKNDIKIDVSSNYSLEKLEIELDNRLAV